MKKSLYYLLPGLGIMIFIFMTSGTSYINRANPIQKNPPLRYHGEFGLYVKKAENQVEVRWIGKSVSEGVLKVMFDGKTVDEKVTKSSRSHKASFVFEKEGLYTIQYGAKGDSDDSQSTEIFLSKKKTSRASYDVKNIAKLYAVGDTHGYYDNLSQLLRNNGLMDENENWAGGDSHLIFLGDLFDRGPDVTKNLWMIYQLDMQAKKSGGGVHIVLGNHEIMAFTNDLRFVTPKENSMAATHGLKYSDMFDLKETILGAWLASKPSIMRVDEMLFAHGGIITNYGDFSLQKFNDSVYAFMQEPMFKQLGFEPLDTINFNAERIKERAGFFYAGFTPYWYRGYVTSESTSKELDIILRKFASVVHIVGHTPQKTITQYHRGKLIATDLHEKATEILLMTRKKKRKYDRKKYDLLGNEIKF